MAKTGSIAIQMADILNDVEKGASEALDDGIKYVSKECVQKLKNTSPKGSPHRRKYAEGWSVKKTGDKDAVVYNRTNYQLTHLLENGHVIRNKKGEFGRTNGIKHIQPVEEWANDELPRRVMEDLDRL